MPGTLTVSSVHCLPHSAVFCSRGQWGTRTLTCMEDKTTFKKYTIQYCSSAKNLQSGKYQGKWTQQCSASSHAFPVVMQRVYCALQWFSFSFLQCVSISVWFTMHSPMFYYTAWYRYTAVWVTTHRSRLCETADEKLGWVWMLVHRGPGEWGNVLRLASETACSLDPRELLSVCTWGLLFNLDGTPAATQHFTKILFAMSL